jgi:hypothetical protein
MQTAKDGVKTVVIYHRADFDGLFCREIARKFLPGAELIGFDYGDPEPVVAPDARLYIMDLRVPSLMGHKHLIWIDHHKSSIAEYPDNIPGYRIDGVAACRLAWQWFNNEHSPHNRDCPPADYNLPTLGYFHHRQVDEPASIMLAGEYDVWDKRDPEAELFQHGLRSIELTPKHWDALVSSYGLDRSLVKDLLAGGRVLQYAREKEYEEVILQQGFTVDFEGRKFLACNSHRLDIRSHLFAAGIKPEHEGLLGFTWTGGLWSVSMYGVPGKPDIDFSAIALKYGGGGHKQACGFKTTKLPFLG